MPFRENTIFDVGKPFGFKKHGVSQLELKPTIFRRCFMMFHGVFCWLNNRVKIHRKPHFCWFLLYPILLPKILPMIFLLFSHDFPAFIWATRSRKTAVFSRFMTLRSSTNLVFFDFHAGLLDGLLGFAVVFS